MSIITNGLGSSPSNLILGQFGLGFLEVTIEPEPPVPPTVTGGGGGIFVPPIQKQRITFTIRHRGHTWKKEYIVDESKGLILIRITKTINKVMDNIKIVVKGIKKKLGAIEISLWKR